MIINIMENTNKSLFPCSAVQQGENFNACKFFV